MSVADLIPLPDALPVHWLWFQGLLTLTFLLHLLVMNLLLGGGIIALVNQVRSSGDLALSRDVGKKLPYCLAFTVNFGVAPLLFLQVLYGQFFYSSTVFMAWFWLSIIPLLIISYYLAYIHNSHFERLGDSRSVLLAVVLLALLLIGFFFVNNLTMMQLPTSWGRFLSRPSGLLLNLADPTLWPRYLHFLLSALAVAGLALALLSRWQLGQGRATAAAGLRQGVQWFTWSTIGNFGVGFWFFGILPGHVRDVSTPHGAALAVCLLVGIAAAAFSVVMAQSRQLRPAVSSLLLSILAMVLLRDLVRGVYLKPYFSPASLPVQ
ncbi:MAG: hypothetical protein BWK76_27550, partial [Desulfobulbaceae bacterium A2]